MRNNMSSEEELFTFVRCLLLVFLGCSRCWFCSNILLTLLQFWAGNSFFFFCSVLVFLVSIHFVCLFVCFHFSLLFLFFFFFWFSIYKLMEFDDGVELMSFISRQHRQNIFTVMFRKGPESQGSHCLITAKG